MTGWYCPVIGCGRTSALAPTDKALVFLVRGHVAKHHPDLDAQRALMGQIVPLVQPTTVVRTITAANASGGSTIVATTTTNTTNPLSSPMTVGPVNSGAPKIPGNLPVSAPGKHMGGGQMPDRVPVNSMAVYVGPDIQHPGSDRPLLLSGQRVRVMLITTLGPDSGRAGKVVTVRYQPFEWAGMAVDGDTDIHDVPIEYMRTPY